MIEAKKLDGYREQLRQLADRLRGDVSTVTEMTRGAAGGQGAGELTNVPMHLGDMGTEEFMKDLNATLLVNEEFLVNEVVAALDRVNAGTFGQCEACSQEIATARLEVLPYARYCVRCAEKTQSGVEVNLNHGRPQSPRDTLQPEGEMGEYRRATKNSDFASVRADEPQKEFTDDRHAAGTAGGGTAIGGLAGTNSGHGEPTVGDLQEAMGSGEFEMRDARDDEPDTPRSGRGGGAVGGTPANKRAK